MDAIGQLNAGLVGRYALEREIGAGGMATVFLARDLRHERRVALKVLKPELGALVGADRFLSEIRVTANLQHPNLLPLFDSGEAAGLLFYVMPYIEGETLRQRLDRERQLPVDEAVRLAVAICGALDYAHRHGIIHRDLKPENILLHDGQPLVADFGIALAVSNAGGERVTQTGISLGTPQYMSPEQATGDRTIDARTDVYSVGALAYEMLAGEPPHIGSTAQAVIAKLLTEEPRPLSVLRRSVPAYVDGAVQRALQKLPADRFTAARDFAEALSGKGAMVSPSPVAHSRSLIPWKVATGVSVALAVAAAAWVVTQPAPIAVMPQMRFPLGLPDDAQTNSGGFSRSIDLSADGSQIVYVGTGGLYVRRLADVIPRRVTSDLGEEAKFSPDGAWVAYVSNGALRKVRVTGGAPEQIADSVARFGWSSRGVIVFTRSGRGVADLWKVSENGGRPESFIQRLRSTDISYGTPSFFADGDRFLIPVVTPDNPLPQIGVGRVSDGSMQYLAERGAHPLYVADGILLFVDRDFSLMAVSLDSRTLEVRGRPVRVPVDVKWKGSSVELAVASNGTMVYIPGMVPQQLVEIDRNGRIDPLPHDPGVYATPRYSPDGSRVALTVMRPAVSEKTTPTANVWIYDLSSPTVRQLTNSHRAATPGWTHDGKRVGWTELEAGAGLRAAELTKHGTFWRSADGRDSTTTLVEGGLATVFSPTADLVVTVLGDSGGRRALTVVQLDSARRRTRLRNVSVPPSPSISPDGRWLAYVSDESGRAEVYVTSMTPSGRQTRISAGGGTEPVWNPRGKELFYRTGSHLVSTTLTLDAELRVVRHDTLPFKLPGAELAATASYDVSRDGQRFLTVKPTAIEEPIVVTGWFAELRKLAPVR